MNKLSKKQVFIDFLMLCAATNLKVRDVPKTVNGALDTEALKKANEPVAHTQAFNLHKYIIRDICGSPDYEANQLMFRYVQPIGKILLYGTIPTMISPGPGICRI
ncbi:MAG: hypothetical protein LBV74_02210 [Tannerella sp.]|jgi:hypothetical protein|nr:hypothetical protein [Tannerella sp.]